eukprot:12933953-Prorocentrum_lima.AAC.1
MWGPQDPPAFAAWEALNCGSTAGPRTSVMAAANSRLIVVGSCSGRRLRAVGVSAFLGIHTARSSGGPTHPWIPCW